MQLLEERAGHAHHQVNLAAAQRANARLLVLEEDKGEVRDARLVLDEVFVVRNQFHAIFGTVVRNLEWPGPVELTAGVGRVRLEDQGVVVAQVVQEKWIGLFQFEDDLLVAAGSDTVDVGV